MDQVRFTSADVATSLKAPVTVTETSLTSVASVAATESQRVIATAMETNSMPSAFVEATAKRMQMAMDSVMPMKSWAARIQQPATSMRMPHSMTDRVPTSTHVGCVEALAPSTIADVKTFPKEIVIAMETKTMPSACVAVIASRT